MKKQFNYYAGFFLGTVIATLIVVYAFYDGYLNYRNGKSVAGDLALLFVFFAWQKISKLLVLFSDFISYVVTNLRLQELRKEE